MEMQLINQPMAVVSTNEIVHATYADCEDVLKLFGELHCYNASLDSHFALADNWQTLLRTQFRASWNNPEMRWLLVKDGCLSVALLIAGIHTDSSLFKHRQWIEIQALYVADTHRRLGIAGRLLDHTYRWADSIGLPRVQLYVTASNVRAQALYAEEGFSITQAIMRKKLN